ncbi:NAD(P)-binding protein [Mycena olivaceomarginata]|nr:NAD(P)-binding protein [Mycena olivaceomarginata]
MAFIAPVRSHPEAVVYAVVARSKERAAVFAKTHGIEKVFGGSNSYQELLDDPEIDAIYNPLLPPGNTFYSKKPAANTAEETRKMFELAENKGLVLLEAVHYRFISSGFIPSHTVSKPSSRAGELGAVKKHINCLYQVPRGIMKADDIRFNYSLGGGALMDMGCYTINAIRYFAGADPTAVLSAEHELVSPQIDRKTVATFSLPGSITSTILCDLSCAPEAQAHPGEPWWTTYRYQLEAFVNKVKGRTPMRGSRRKDSIKNMEAIESVYAKSGLGSRPKSEYVPN